MTIDPNESNPHEEPCLSCGEETADRSAAKLPDGTRGYLCSECVRRIRAAGHIEVTGDARDVEVSVVTLAQGWF
jgi:DNA-directed RNA polymerase subunit RPC12/RpoP